MILWPMGKNMLYHCNTGLGWNGSIWVGSVAEGFELSEPSAQSASTADVTGSATLLYCSLGFIRLARTRITCTISPSCYPRGNISPTKPSPLCRKLPV